MKMAHDTEVGISAFPSSFPEEVAQLEVAGIQNLADLLHQGVVRLWGTYYDSPAQVVLCHPQYDVDLKVYRAQLSVDFADRLEAVRGTPLPDSLVAFVTPGTEVEPGNRDWRGMCGFYIENWGVYSPEGARVRHEPMRFTIKNIHKLELLPQHQDVSTAIGTTAAIGVCEVDDYEQG